MGYFDPVVDPNKRASGGLINTSGTPQLNPPMDEPPDPNINAADDGSYTYGADPTIVAPPGPSVFSRIGNAAQRISNPTLYAQNNQNATVDPSLAAPRQPHNAYLNFNGQPPAGATQYVGVPQVEKPPGLPPGPISAAVQTMGGGPESPAPRDYGTELAATNAKQGEALQEQRNQGFAMNRAAQSSFDLANAQQAARVSRFRATDGADMVLATENRGYDEQRKGIIDAANADQGVVNGLQGQVNANLNDAVGKHSYVNDFAKTQEEINRGKVADRVGAVGAQNIEGMKLDNASKQQIQTLRAQLAAETDPAKQKILQNKLLAIEGKQPQGPKIAIIDVEGPPDISGNPTKMRKAMDLETGKLVGENGAGNAGTGMSPVPEAIAYLKAHPDMASKFEALYGKGSAAQYLGK